MAQIQATARDESVSQGIVLPARPVIYEINTWVWLDELRGRLGRPVTLGTIPASEWEAVAAMPADAVWLMGVWERSPLGAAIAANDPGLMAACREALPDLTPDDFVGSPYCVRRYEVDSRLGGRAELAAARAELAQRGVGLILDFVPNHVAPDHPWTREHPEYFIQGTPADLAATPEDYYQVGETILARGRDPFFPPWPDVVQLNAFSPELRAAMTETLLDIGEQCDGLRCDMAMLMTNEVFVRTWGERAGAPLPEEYWPQIIPAIHQTHPHLCFIAEVYWDMEWTMMTQGFNYCYDKRLYDRLEQETAESVRQHLTADPSYQDRLVRFIENHDEARAAATFGPERMYTAAVVTFTLPGARLLYEGQADGREVKLPVFLSRRPAEPPDRNVQTFYRRLLPLLRMPALNEGQWQLCALTGWSGNESFHQLAAWSWQSDTQQCVIVVNLTDTAAQGRVQLVWPQLAGQTWVFQDRLSGAAFEHSGDEILNAGLYVDLPAWGYHFFELR
ncbi:MAG: alpha-amylase family glycosyl hydrolase [Chloroflexota bacterium]